MIFNMSSGGGKKCPVLDEQYPESVSINATESATFQVKIAEDGKPNAYTYQWYENGNVVEGATSATYVRSTTKNDAGEHIIWCEVTSEAGTVVSVAATLSVDDSLFRTPEFTYSGTYALTNDSGTTVAQDALVDNWKLTFKTGGTLKFTKLNSAAKGIDVFCVGGGGGGHVGNGGYGGSGGGGGYTTTEKNVPVSLKSYTITVGAGGGSGADGGNTSAFDVTANGGKVGNGNTGGAGGSGGGGACSVNRTNGANGGSDGGNGSSGDRAGGGAGQGTTTREFGKSSGTLYSGGGGSAHYSSSPGSGGSGGGGAGGGKNKNGKSGTANTGGGGGGAITIETTVTAGSGGSGIAIIRNTRS